MDVLDVLPADGLGVHLAPQVGQAENVEVALIRQADQTVLLVGLVRARREGDDGHAPHLAARVGRQFVLAVRAQVG